MPRTRDYKGLFNAQRVPQTMFEQYLRMFWLSVLSNFHAGTDTRLVNLALRDMAKHLPRYELARAQRVVQAHACSPSNIQTSLNSPYIKLELEILSKP
jgi:hypothetical protein